MIKDIYLKIFNIPVLKMNYSVGGGSSLVSCKSNCN